MTPEEIIDNELAAAPCACGRRQPATRVVRDGPVRVYLHVCLDVDATGLSCPTRCEVCGHRETFKVLTAEIREVLT